jgi:hypothetical protein
MNIPRTPISVRLGKVDDSAAHGAWQACDDEILDAPRFAPAANA